MVPWKKSLLFTLINQNKKVLHAQFLFIGAYNTPDRMNEYTYSYDPEEKFGGKGDTYLDWIEQTLLPQMQS